MGETVKLSWLQLNILSDRAIWAEPIDQFFTTSIVESDLVRPACAKL